MSLVSIQDVSFSFGKEQVLKNVTFKIQKGDFVGLIGPNGSGKTTLLHLLLGFYPLQKGDIKIQNTSIKEFKDWEAIGYVPQKAAHIKENFPATVKEIVATGLLSKKSFPRRFTKQDQAQVTKALKRVDMHTYQDRRINDLSGGQQQRVLIARALITNPKLLILDEPTTGVDQASQDTFYDYLNKINKEGTSILLVSHDLGRITHYVTKIAHLNKTLSFYESHEEFCAHPDEDTRHHCLNVHTHHHKHKHKEGKNKK